MTSIKHDVEVTFEGMRWVYRVKQSQRVIEQNARVLLGEMCHITKTSLPEDQRLADHALITAIFKEWNAVKRVYNQVVRERDSLELSIIANSIQGSVIASIPSSGRPAAAGYGVFALIPADKGVVPTDRLSHWCRQLTNNYIGYGIDMNPITGQRRIIVGRRLAELLKQLNVPEDEQHSLFTYRDPY